MIISTMIPIENPLQKYPLDHSKSFAVFHEESLDSVPNDAGSIIKNRNNPKYAKSFFLFMFHK